MSGDFTVVETVAHLGEQWSVVRRGEQYFARFDFNRTLVGPYSNAEQAREFVTTTAFDAGPLHTPTDGASA